MQLECKRSILTMKFIRMSTQMTAKIKAAMGSLVNKSISAEAKMTMQDALTNADVASHTCPILLFIHT